MSLTGSLNAMDFAELLQWLARGRKTGMLLVANQRVQKRIFFKDGRVISSASSDPTEHLGHFLVSQGFLDEVTLAQAIEMQEGNRMLLGKILTTIGALGEVELEQMLRLKAEESIYSIFTWDDAEFQFVEDELPTYEMVPISLEVQTLVLRGAKRLDDWTRIRQVIKSKHCIPVAVGKLVAPEGDPGADKVLELVNDDRTIEEIALETHSSEFYVCRVLWEQLRQGTLKVVRSRQADVLAPAPSEGGEESIDASTLLDVADAHLKGGGLLPALRHLRAARDLDPDSNETKAASTRIEEAIHETLEEQGITDAAVPHLSGNLSDLSNLDISAEEAFILSRIDGKYDLGTILKISPIPTLETRVVLWKLLQAGHIYLD